MSNWIIVIIALLLGGLLGGLSAYLEASDDDTPASNNKDDNNSTSYSRPVDTIERQDLYSCIARFVGAISTIRDHCTWRSWIQQGYITVTRKENGTYDIVGRYDHDSNYDIQNQLQRGGYLDYLGMKYVEDGFTYQVNEIDPKRNGVISTDDRMLITDKYIVSVLHKRFGSSINIETARTSDNFTIVSFNFPEQNS